MNDAIETGLKVLLGILVICSPIYVAFCINYSCKWYWGRQDAAKEKEAERQRAKRAAKTERSKSRAKIENKPKIITTSCPSAATAPKANLY